MSNVDGDVKIRVSLDDRNVEKGADRIKNKMQGIARTVTKAFSATARRQDIEQTIAGYEEQARAVEKTIRMEQERLALLKRLKKEVEYDPKARDMADQMGIQDLDAEIDAAYTRIAASRKELRGYNADIRGYNASLRNMSEETSATADAVKKLGDRMSRLARRVFIFNVLRRALLAMQHGLTSLLSQDSAVAKSMAQIKGSLYAAFMPIYNFILPAIRTLLNFLAQLASAIASIIGGLFGVSTAALKNASALKQQAGATGAAGGAAKKAAKSIAAFDEINQLSDDESGGGGGGGGGAGGASWDFSGLDQVSSKMRTIAKIVLSIAAGIAAWKLATALGALKDASMLRNLGFITGAALTIWAALDLIVPGIMSIINEGPNIENVLETIAGIFIVLGGVSFMLGNFGSGLVWIALGLGALIASDWDTVSDALQKWDDKISDLLKDTPLLEKAYEGFKWVILEVVEGFQQIAGIVVKLATEPLSFDILAEIGDMNFAAAGITSLVTAKLIGTIGKMIGLSGTIGVAAGGIVLSLLAAADIAMDIRDLVEGDSKIKQDALFSLIVKALFGAVAAVITLTLGGGGFALLFTVPIGIKLATTILGQSEAESEGLYAEDIENAIRAAKSVEELRSVISGFTNLDITDDFFNKFIGPNVTEEMRGTTAELDELKAQTLAFAGIFHAQSGTEGFEAWLKSLGLLTEGSTKAAEGLGTTTAQMEKIAQKASETKTSVEETTTAIEAVSDVTVDSASLDNLGETASTLETDFDSVETSLGNVETAAENVGLAMSEDASSAISDMQTEAVETGNVMSSTFALTAMRIRTALTTNLKNVFKQFSSGGSIFKGIETGIANSFKRIMNSLIDGLNSVLSNSFGKINDALDKIRNTQVGGVKPFISLPRVSISKIPKLAEGAVIPANREFLAILGDQKNGTNIEAPLDTIVEAVMIAMAKAGMDGGNIAAAMKSALNGLSLKVGKREIGYVVADAINSNRRDEGKLALNL